MMPIVSLRVSRPFLAWITEQVPAPAMGNELAWKVLDRHAERIVIHTQDEVADVVAQLDRIAARRYVGNVEGTRRHFAAKMAARLRRHVA